MENQHFADIHLNLYHFQLDGIVLLLLYKCHTILPQPTPTLVLLFNHTSAAAIVAVFGRGSSLTYYINVQNELSKLFVVGKGYWYTAASAYIQQIF